MMNAIEEAIKRRLHELHGTEYERVATEYRKIDESFPMRPVYAGLAVCAFMGWLCGIGGTVDPSSWFITKIFVGISFAMFVVFAVVLIGMVAAWVGYVLFGSRGFDVMGIASIFCIDACFAVTLVFGRLPSEPSNTVYLLTFGVLSVMCLVHSIRLSIAHQERLTAFLNSMPPT